MISTLNKSIDVAESLICLESENYHTTNNTNQDLEKMNEHDCDFATLSMHLFPSLPGLLEATASKSTLESSPCRSTLLFSKLENSAAFLPCSPFNASNGKAFVREC